MLLFYLFLACGVGVFIFSFFQDSSFFQKTNKSLSPKSAENGDVNDKSQVLDKGLQLVKSLPESNGTNGKKNNPPGPGGVSPKANLKAIQVIVRSGEPDPDKSLPLGSNFIGKLLSKIDTRDTDGTVRVLLPYGVKGKSNGHIDKDSILMGKVSYPGKGEKVFIQFNRGVDPQGKEFEIDAVALNSKDYSNGLKGEFHGTTDVRVATTLGLTMVSGATDVLTEKESVGNSYDSVNPKSTMQNALLHGVSQVSQTEAGRQADKLNEAQDYVTVEEGSDVIVTLTKAFIEK